MDIIHFNNSWMLFNIFLALLPILFGLVMLWTKNTILRLTSGIFWLLFIPNSIYLLTDIGHLFEQWHRLTPIAREIVIAQYAILMFLGVVTFIYALHPFAILIKGMKHSSTILIAVNFLIGFGMVLGRIQRNNSWDVFFNPTKVIHSSIHTLTDPQLLFYAIMFSILCNIIYFGAKKTIFDFIGLKIDKL